ncbi:MAG TPA: hypothetical protein VGN03_09110 [Steroidobacteraceae bacterium]
MNDGSEWNFIFGSGCELLNILVLAGMDDDIPVVVRMRVECARCGHAEDDMYEFDMPRAESEPMEEYVPGKCPERGSPIHMHLKRTQQVQ